MAAMEVLKRRVDLIEVDEVIEEEDKTIELKQEMLEIMNEEVADKKDIEKIADISLNTK